MTSATDLEIGRGEHVVYFYDDERSLAATTAGFLGAALADGGAAIAIATDAHRAAFAAELSRAGANVTSAERTGRLVFLDARRTLDQILVDGAPDPGRFEEVIATAIAGLARGQGPVCAFGEMVGLLWDAGDVEAVIALEQLWNDLLATGTFSFLCGYRATALADGSADSIVPVCESHSAVVSGLPAPAGPQAAKTFGKAAQSPRRARAFVAATLSAWGVRAEVHDDAALVVTELATNAINHAQSGFMVSLDRVDERIRITVGDTAQTPPALLSADARAESGRGLLLVEAVAAAWGSTPTDGGKLVWAEIG